jgi:hypothetical protein
MPNLSAVLSLFGFSTLQTQTALIKLHEHASQTKTPKSFSSWPQGIQWLVDSTQKHFRSFLFSWEDVDERKGWSPLIREQRVPEDEFTLIQRCMRMLQPVETSLLSGTMLLILGGFWNEIETCLSKIPASGKEQSSMLVRPGVCFDGNNGHWPRCLRIGLLYRWMT